MRLPQSSSAPFSLRFASNSILLTLALAIVPPLSARQATSTLVASPADSRFGEVVIGQSETQEFVLSNTGDTSATVSAISVSNSEFSVSGVSLPVTVGAGQSVTLKVTFSPQDAGSTAAEVTITSNAENPTLQIALRATGAASQILNASPASLSFGQVSVGSSTSRSVVVSNPNSTNETVSKLVASGSGFSVSGPQTPFTLASGQSVTLTVSFTPQAAGPYAGDIFAVGDRLDVPLTGKGTSVGQLTVTPGTLSFGNVDVGSSTTQPSTMTATGGSVTVSSASSSNSQFSITGVSLPVTINEGQSVSFDVVFSPTKAGAETATVSFASNSSNQGSEALSGTGVAEQYSVSLSWNASSGVSGYNVYRGTTAGSYSKINSTLDATTSYTDTTVTSGVTYYYAATSVDSSGQESGYSSPVQVTVP